jgi:hypothetical protein
LIEGGIPMFHLLLKKPPVQWNDDPTFNELRDRSFKLVVVNDVAERGIILIKKYNNTLMKNEEQKQLLVRLVVNHRKKVQFSYEGSSNVIVFES